MTANASSLSVSDLAADVVAADVAGSTLDRPRKGPSSATSRTNVTLLVAAGAIAVAVLLAIGLLLGRSAPAEIKPSTSASPSASAPSVSWHITLLTATFVAPVTTYTVSVSDPSGVPLTYQWSASITCGTFTPSGASAAWAHPDKSLGGDCPDEPVHKGAIAVTVTDAQGNSQKITYVNGSAQGSVTP